MKTENYWEKSRAVLVPDELIRVQKINSRNLKEESFIFVAEHSVLMLEGGWLEVRINGVCSRLDAGCQVCLYDLGQLQFLSVSPDFLGWQLIAQRDFISESLRGMNPFPLSFTMQIQKDPVLRLSREETALLVSCMKQIRITLEREKQVFRKEILQHQLSVFLLEMGQIVIGRDEHYRFERNASHREQILLGFFTLLTQHYWKEHGVGFYARELCISPQYLARIVRELTGKTVYSWISEMLLVRAKTLLLTNQSAMSVQQVSDILHFSDQAAFGKFFKRHTGQSPVQFRRSG
ncbi:MAG: helix-turn-helix domain-containing protein [Mangrovibacterium sp.]